MRLLLAALAFVGALSAAHAGQSRAFRQWGGPDLPVSCDAVRRMAPMANVLSEKARRELIRKYRVSRKMLRQAKRCLQ